MGGRNKVSKKKTNTQKNGYIAYVCVSPICAKTKKKTQRRTVSPSALHLASAYYQLRTLCIWSLTKLLRIGLKSPFFIHRIIIYIHAIHHRQILNFLKLFGLEDGKGVKHLPNRSEGVQCYPKLEVFDTFFIFHALQMLAKSILSPKMTHFL